MNATFNLKITDPAKPDAQVCITIDGEFSEINTILKTLLDKYGAASIQ